MADNLKKIFLTAVVFILFIFMPSRSAFCRSTPHHIYNISRRLVETVGAPFYGAFVAGPKNIKKTWHEEVWEQEKPEKRGKFKYKAAAVMRSPGEEAKGIIDGVTSSVSSFGSALKEFVSIFFGD
ncbi:MAG: hypothetical protein JW788_03650 [Candidatus Omnitrophica bacterium]|nr:hypothetical protein [Candidatus Omnitrophota bacterium]